MTIEELKNFQKRKLCVVVNSEEEMAEVLRHFETNEECVSTLTETMERDGLPLAVFYDSDGEFSVIGFNESVKQAVGSYGGYAIMSTEAFTAWDQAPVGF